MLRLSPTDWAILDHLEEHGNASPAMIADATDKSAQHVRQSVRDLDTDHGLVHRPVRGIYTLTDRGERALDHRDLHPSPRFEEVIRDA